MAKQKQKGQSAYKAVAEKMAARLDNMCATLTTSGELRKEEILTMKVAAHLIRQASRLTIARALIAAQQQTLKFEQAEGPMCNECDVRMELVGASDSPTGSTWRCPDCGWSDDTGAY